MFTNLPLTGLLLLLVQTAIAQPIPVTLTIDQPVRAGSTTNEVAAQHLLATNRINPSARATYRTGQSVTLLPGFRASAGSVFTATIEAVVLPTPDASGFTVAAYPNPVNSSVTIDYTLPTTTRITRTLTNAEGQTLAETIGAEPETAGRHQISVDMNSIPIGVYLLHFQTDTGRQSVRLVKL